MKLHRHPGKVRLRLNPGVAGYFKERIGRLRQAAGEKIEVQPAVDITWEDYQIIVE